MVEQLIASARKRLTVYAVPGHPLVGEATVQAALRACVAEGIPTRLVEGLSFLDSVFAILHLDPLRNGLGIHDALSPPRQIDGAALFAQLYSTRVASGLKLTLMESLPDDFEVALVFHAGGTHQRVEWLPLFEIDRRQDIDHLTCLYLPEPPLDRNLGSFHNLRRIVAHLRAPDGCPWDREQTHRSLSQFLVEETYEVVDTLESGDPEKMAEELGDLLLQILLHAQIGEDEGAFAIEQVIEAIAGKMIRRHPHVFGSASASSAAEVVQRWEAIKQKERPAEESVLAGVPRHLPALAYAEAVQRKAASMGFEWPAVTDAVAKVAEEAEEVIRAPDLDARRDEFGDLLFALSNVARMSGVNAEEALRGAGTRFAARFRFMEARARALGASLAQMSLPQMLALWEEAKTVAAGDAPSA